MLNKEELSKEDLNFIIESLKYTRKAFEETQTYPDYEFGQKRIETVNNVMSKIQSFTRKL
jgi:hypothetical protein